MCKPLEWSSEEPCPAASAPELVERMQERFDGVASFTIGAEEEFLLLDPDTLRLTPAIEQALVLFEGDPRVTAEFRAAQLETVSNVAASVADLTRELAAIRRLVSQRLSGRALLAAAGTHPKARDLGPITPHHRYERLAAAFPWAERRMLTCGLHVHVSVGGAERALAVHNALRSYLPEIAAVAANSPFHEGRDSGLATVRPGLNQSLPRAGVPPAFASWEAMAEFVAWGSSAGTAPDASFQWWDLRLHPGYGTIEVRVADVQTTVADTATVVALVQSLVGLLSARYDAGEPLPVHPSERIIDNMWLATRDGIGGSLANLETGERLPTPERLFALVEELLPTAAELGCDSELLGVGSLVRDGGGAGRQRAVAQTHGMGGLLAWLAAETVGAQTLGSGRPAPWRPLAASTA